MKGDGALNSYVRDIIEKIPDKPGVYQFYDNDCTILYIGKAKNLKKRVASYFNKPDSSNFKQRILVRKIREVKYILVDNESDALLLENNLIKEYKPKYNVLLKDDKTFPWICIKNEPFSRLYYTRKVVDDGSEYFGPYTSVVMIKTLFKLIRQLYMIRTCNYLLNQENIQNKKYKRCLEYHMGNCKAPCEGLQDEDDYRTSLQQIREILKGNLYQVIQHLQKIMLTYADAYQFEEAEMIRKKLEILEKYKAKSTIVNPGISDVEVYSIIDEPKSAYVNFMKLVNGAIVQSHNIELIKKIEENKEDILSFAIYNLRQRFESNSKEIITPFMPSMQKTGIKITIPVKGDKRKLLDLSFRNANSYRLDSLKDNNIHKKSTFIKETLVHLQQELRLKTIPEHIECIDISNIQGSSSVAACVVFKSGIPSKKDYRHYHIKSVTGSNDYASIEEIVRRRCLYFKENQLKLPDLFIIDGGKGQLSAALKGIKSTGQENKIAIIGIAKRLEEIYVPGDPLPLYIDKNSPGLKLIQRIRNEAHRFGISFHRKKRSKLMLISELDAIKGIGPLSKNKILLNTRDIEEIKEMSLDELASIVGRKAGNILFNHFKL